MCWSKSAAVPQALDKVNFEIKQHSENVQGSAQGSNHGLVVVPQTLKVPVLP